MSAMEFAFEGLAERLDVGRPMFRIQLDWPGQGAEAVWLDADTAAGMGDVVTAVETGQAEPRRQEITYRLAHGEDRLAVRVVFERAGREVLATLALEHQGPGRVRQVQFPVVEVETHTFDRLLMASAWGDDIPQPPQTIREVCDAGGNRKRMGMDYIATGRDELIYTYPSIMAMQHMVLYNDARSLYVACYSDDEQTRTFRAAAVGKYRLRLAIGHHPFATGPAHFETSPCGLALLDGGWHTAADLYASHMRERFRPAQRPAWLSESFHGWVELNMKTEGQPPRHRFADLPGLYRDRVAPAGINVIKIAGWCGVGFDRNYPDYRVNPELGSAEELKAACDEVRRLGGRVEFYTNFRLVDPDSDFYRAGGSQYVCLDEAGEPYIESYGTSAKFRIACPACPPYGDYLAEQVRRMIVEYGAGAMQVDQTSCNLAHFCFDGRHPHPTPATNFAGGLEELLRKVRAVYRSLDEGFYVWGEGCHERFGRQYDIHQGHGEEFTWQVGRSTPEHFSYVYPDALVTGHAKTGVQGLCYSHAQGKPFDVSLRCLDDALFAELLQRFVAVRAAWPGYFLRGRFRDSTPLEWTGPVRAFAIERGDGAGLLVNLWRPGSLPADTTTARLRHPRPGTSAESVAPTGAAVTAEGDWLELRWQGPVLTLVFEE